MISRAEFYSDWLTNYCRNCGEAYLAYAHDWSPETGTCWDPIMCPACIKDERLDEVSP